MEDLGLALIDEYGKTLSSMMHHVRERASEGRSLIRASVETLFDGFFSNQGMSRMIMQESMSRGSVFREASERLFLTMSAELADFLVRDAKDRGVPLGYPKLAANSMLSIVFTTGIALLNTPTGDRDRHKEATIIKLRMIMHGAESLGDNR